MPRGKTIALASSKGGVGKTTIAMALAGEAAHRALKTILIDADPNAPLMRWATGAHLPTEIEVRAATAAKIFPQTLAQARDDADLVIVDAEGSLNRTLLLAIGEADLTLTPLQASKLDAEEAAKIVAIVKKLRADLGVALAHAILFSRVSAALRDKSYARVKSVFAAHGVPSMATELVERAAFKAAFDHGASLRSLPPGAASTTEKAIANAAALFDEAMAMIDQSALEGVS